MPRPTAAQLSYGSATVIFSTVAMLLLSQTQTGVGVAVIVLAALVLGLLVALTVPMPKAARAALKDHAAASVPPTRVPQPRTTRAGAERVSEHSLRR
ncbi:hypothetical protein [Streptomyces beijiangensis]|uniref:Uncharacterized protein n=1 Tax=Streptomyces beijiangensis TaxID=163361 RepID=A0A939JKE0_9ACTN|nr:hypothetical protein [Streptomyces beijiangensis]MBO0517533.1 hypothetical protein [Streptomyces beijiangensis]